MDNKNNVAMYSLVFLVVGIFVGWLIWGSSMMNRVPRMGVHEMENGHMMNDEGMSMSGMMDDMMAELEGKKGDAFDKAFIEEMIVHHEGAVEMAEAALMSAKHKEIKDMANAIISTQTSEIDQMKTWLKTWYGEKSI